ncbi:hypothetical protein [Streptomyces sp. NPDC018584]|uniref:hypothetical protein n=1 Tax=unclassified Streptomyces TaxID=2593676 RepID=UPI003791812E
MDYMILVVTDTDGSRRGVAPEDVQIEGRKPTALVESGTGVEPSGAALMADHAVIYGALLHDLRLSVMTGQLG